MVIVCSIRGLTADREGPRPRRRVDGGELRGVGLGCGKRGPGGEWTYAGASLPTAGPILVAQRTDDFIIGIGDGEG